MRASPRRAASLALLCGLIAAAAAQGKGAGLMTVIHANDIHARYDVASTGFGSCASTDVDGAACFGGMPRMATAIEAARQQAAAAGSDSLVLFAGDIYSGTSYDVVYTSQGDQIAPEFLAALGVQAMTLGNHEFDFGPETVGTLVGNLTDLGIPVLACNIDASAEPSLAGMLEPFTLIRLPKSNVTVGVVGLTTPDTAYTSQPGPNIRFLPPNETLPECVAAARKAGAERIIALTHLGYDEDVELAGSPAAAGVDLIVGAHSHSLLYGPPPATPDAGDPTDDQLAAQGAPKPVILASPPTNESTAVSGPYPTLIRRPDGRTVPVVTAMWASRYLGVLNTTWGADGLESAAGSPVLLGGANSTNPVAADPEVQAELQAKEGPIDEMNSDVVGFSSVYLDGQRANVRGQETNLADMQCDALVWYTRTQQPALLERYPNSPLTCLLGGGSIRGSLEAGNITLGDLEDVNPFGDWLVIKQVNASTLQQALNHGLSSWTGDDTATGGFPQVGGALRYAFDHTLPENARLVAAQVAPPATADSGSSGSPVPLGSFEGDMLILIDNYYATGGDDFDMLEAAPTILDTSTQLVDIFQTYLREFSPVAPATDGRVADCAVTPSAPLCSAVPPPPGEPAAPPSAAGSLSTAAPPVAFLVLLATLLALF